MSYERLEAEGGLQWPCSDENHPGELFLHGRLWEEPVERAAGAVLGRRARAAGRRLDEEYPFRLTTGRRLDSYNTGVQTGGYTSPLRRGETLDISPEDARAPGRRRRASSCASARAAARVVAPARIDAGCGRASSFMTLHFPDEVATNLLTIDATDPKSGTAEFKACAVRIEPVRPPSREPAAHVAARQEASWICTCSTQSRPTRSAPRSMRCSARRVRLGRRRPASERRDGARRGRRPRGARAAPPAAAGAAGASRARVGWISGAPSATSASASPCRRPTPTAWHVLRAVPDAAAPAGDRPRLRRHRLPLPGRRGALPARSKPRSAPGRDSGRADAPGIAAPASASASGRPRRW